jgi:AcrR family transcriptional regulator
VSSPIQQQLITARKNQILDAAATVFADKGFHPTTTKEIAKQAGISEGTIYNYFDSKPALLLGIFERMKATIIEESRPFVTDVLDLRSFLRTFLAQPLVALQKDNFVLFRIVISEMMVNTELRTRYHAQILEPTLMLAETYLGEQMLKRGYSPEGIRLTLRAISGMVMGVMMQYVMGDSLLEAQWEQLPDVLTDLLINGLGDVPR